MKIVEFFKSLVQNYKEGEASDKLGIISDIASICGVIYAFVVSMIAANNIFNIAVEEVLFFTGIALFLTAFFGMIMAVINLYREIIYDALDKHFINLILLWGMQLAIFLILSSIYAWLIKLVIKSLAPQILK